MALSAFVIASCAKPGKYWRHRGTRNVSGTVTGSRISLPQVPIYGDFPQYISGTIFLQNISGGEKIRAGEKKGAKTQQTVILSWTPKCISNVSCTRKMELWWEYWRRSWDTQITLSVLVFGPTSCMTYTHIFVTYNRVVDIFHRKDCIVLYQLIKWKMLQKCILLFSSLHEGKCLASLSESYVPKFR